MNEDLTAAQWTRARGEKWRAQLTGMEAMLAPIDEPLICALRLDAPCRIADIGCGAGGTALEVLRRAPTGSVVHGFDVSGALIESACNRKPLKENAIEFRVADMATAAAPQQLYDRLVSRFGIMFFDDAPAAFANLARWLTWDGRFAFAVWGRLEDNPWMATVRNTVAEVVKIPESDPESPGPFRYGDADKLLTLLGGAGFGDLSVVDWHGAVPVGGGLPAREAAEFALASFSSFSELLAEAGGDAMNTARELLTARFLGHQYDDVVKMQAFVHLITGAHGKDRRSNSELLDRN